ncbi:lipopolysaccharide biosynthesis protein [Chryseobacterium sp. KACC 21268]|nr:lipopolysaccharide biosynthesis protein [Chryseobacterium sp. KACC 21268]
MSLKKQALSGLVWTFGQQFGTQLINFFISLILARVLLPSDFGIIAMFSVVISISTTLVDGGMASSLIRSNDADDSDLSTVFWFNFFASIILYILIFLFAPLIANFYKLALLVPIIRVYGLLLIIKSLTTVQAIRFTKDLDFKTSFKIQLPSLIIGGILGVVLAYYGFGVWALVYYPLIQSLISTVQYWMYSDWKPSLIFNRVKFKYHFNFGYKMTISSLLETVFNNIYTIVIGKVFSPTQLGYYSRADNLKQLPITNLSNALNKVTFPLFAKLGDDDVKLKDVYKKIMKLVIFIIAPILLMAIVIAEPLIRFLLTEKWLPAVPYFQILSLAGILYPIHSYNLNILMVKGKSDLFLKLEIVKKILIVCVLLISLNYGIMGILWGQVFTSCLSFFVNSHYSGKIIKYGSFQQLADLIPILVLAGLIAMMLYWFDYFWLQQITDLLRMLIICISFTSIYLATGWILKFKEITYLKEILKR